MTSKTHAHIDKVRYNIIMSRAEEFMKTLNDPNKVPIKVFDPLNQQQLDELELIREVSKELHIKKEEDMKKQAQADAKAEEEAKKAAEEKEKEKESQKEEEDKESQKEEEAK